MGIIPVTSSILVSSGTSPSQYFLEVEATSSRSHHYTLHVHILHIYSRVYIYLRGRWDVEDPSEVEVLAAGAADEDPSEVEVLTADEDPSEVEHPIMNNTKKIKENFLNKLTNFI